MEQTGIYEKCEGSKAGKGTAYRVTISGKKFGLGFSDKLVKDLPAGTHVKFTTFERNGFWNIDTLEVLPSIATQAVPVPTAGAEKASVFSVAGKESAYRTPIEIIRTDALTLAEKLITGYANAPLTKKQTNLPKRLELVVSFADHLKRYIETGKVEVLNDDVSKKLEEAVKEGIE